MKPFVLIYTIRKARKRGCKKITVRLKKNGSKKGIVPGVLMNKVLNFEARVIQQGGSKSMIGRFSRKGPIFSPKGRGTRVSTKIDVGLNVFQNFKHTLPSVRIRKTMKRWSKRGMDEISIFKARKMRLEIVSSTIHQSFVAKAEERYEREVIPRPLWRVGRQILAQHIQCLLFVP